ncbi:hypothetical protein PROFUN_02929 [Planoprotostelium fungivorum]|uniref:Uncharacterized protein n=1 Tax=Planoprotostelium fungivorum TaxID=1890364 RepID=A0A2P6NS76_9EUKA|nr:hypothetical protein PROFUN_02929 [Planoprotostelium fungivorum]
MFEDNETKYTADEGLFTSSGVGCLLQLPLLRTINDVTCQNPEHKDAMMKDPLLRTGGTKMEVLKLDSISEEQIFQRCLQNSPKDALVGAKIKKAHPLVKMPDYIYASIQQSGLLKCYLTVNSEIEEEQLHDPEVLTNINFDELLKRCKHYTFPAVSINSNPIPLTFKLPPLSAVEFRPEDKMYCILLALESGGVCLGRGISPPFRISMRISQFINPEAAQERLRRHTKRKSVDVHVSPTPSADYNLTKSLYTIGEQVKMTPDQHLAEMENYLIGQLSDLRARMEAISSPNRAGQTERKSVRLQDLLNDDDDEVFEFHSPKG